MHSRKTHLKNKGYKYKLLYRYLFWKHPKIANWYTALKGEESHKIFSKKKKNNIKRVGGGKSGQRPLTRSAIRKSSGSRLSRSLNFFRSHTFAAPNLSLPWQSLASSLYRDPSTNTSQAHPLSLSLTDTYLCVGSIS